MTRKTFGIFRDTVEHDNKSLAYQLIINISGVTWLGEWDWKLNISPLFHTKELPLHHTISIIYSQTLQLQEKEVTEVQLSAERGRLEEPPSGNPRHGLCGSSVYQDYMTSWSLGWSPS